MTVFRAQSIITRLPYGQNNLGISESTAVALLCTLMELCMGSLDITAGTLECPSNFGDLLSDFNCYVSIVRWLIARPLPPSRERSVQDYPSYPRK